MSNQNPNPRTFANLEPNRFVYAYPISVWQELFNNYFKASGVDGYIDTRIALDKKDPNIIHITSFIKGNSKDIIYKGSNLPKYFRDELPNYQTFDFTQNFKSTIVPILIKNSTMYNDRNNLYLLRVDIESLFTLLSIDKQKFDLVIYTAEISPNNRQRNICVMQKEKTYSGGNRNDNLSALMNDFIYNK